MPALILTRRIAIAMNQLISSEGFTPPEFGHGQWSHLLLKCILKQFWRCAFSRSTGWIALKIKLKNLPETFVLTGNV
jgi:hypothetical protein